ncbi:ABC transporter ATP-binding protein [Planomicrobium sp. Y74]|uniref:ABC transporter ATP-binding protein n=1 Tax=Planomicrobium sp. Y74 TaxID=2478977 RepID=UPI000EF4D343|nr:ABC transporter ATP-binding protein [Planomicrobium sp. Y74]RLQ92766.1 ABC transporter ATP-binding protein [Planomicrobium sp. Y74]
MSIPITLDRLSKSFQAGRTENQVLKDITLKFTSDESTAIVGTSGSGKSTLLSIIGILDRQTDGLFFLGERNVSKMKAGELSEVRFNDMGFIFQQYHLVCSLTVLENVLSPLMMRKVEFNKKERAVSLLERVGLKDHLHKLPSQLSGGQQQRVAVARALINQPAWILADEPTGNLDSAAGETILALLLELKEESGCGLIIVTHDMQLAQKMERQILIQDGEILTDERRAIA